MNAPSTPVVVPGESASSLVVRESRPVSTEELVLLSDPNGVKAEAIRGLRTRIMAQHVQEGRRALAVCTASGGSGCTFVGSNLAVAMSQIGVRTALVDANLRAPSLDRIFGLPDDRPGLVDYLDESVSTTGDVIHADVLPDLSVITAGARPHSPQELLASSRFRALTNQLIREFDLTIFDTTPANTCSDAQRVATVAGYSLIVARRNHSFISDVSMLARLLRADGSIVVGTVLNEC